MRASVSAGAHRAVPMDFRVPRGTADSPPAGDGRLTLDGARPGAVGRCSTWNRCWRGTGVGVPRISCNRGWVCALAPEWEPAHHRAGRRSEALQSRASARSPPPTSDGRTTYSTSARRAASATLRSCPPRHKLVARRGGRRRTTARRTGGGGPRPAPPTLLGRWRAGTFRSVDRAAACVPSGRLLIPLTHRMAGGDAARRSTRR